MVKAGVTQKEPTNTAVVTAHKLHIIHISENTDREKHIVSVNVRERQNSRFHSAASTSSSLSSDYRLPLTVNIINIISQHEKHDRYSQAVRQPGRVAG